MGRTAKYQPESMKKGGPDLRDDALLNSNQTRGSGRERYAAQAFNCLCGHLSACGAPLALEVDLWLFRLGRYLAALYGGHDISGELVDYR